MVAVAAALTLGLAGSARAAPSLSARAAIVVEPDLGVTIYGRRAHDELPIASTTKLMTVYVALRRSRLDRLLTVQPYSPIPGETVAGLRPGERLSLADLLTAMLLPSAGDAAHTVAVDLAGSSARFVGWMNAAAARLNLGQTHFSTEVGVDTHGNYSTAADLARLAGKLLANRFFARTVVRTAARLADGRTVVNRNDLVGRFGFVVGVKTGSTKQAGYCLVGAARRGGVTVITVVLGDPSPGTRDADTLALMRYALALYDQTLAVRAGRVYATIPVYGRPGERVALVAAHSVRLVVRRTAHLVVFPRQLAELARGPLPRRTVLGELVVRLGGRVLATVPLVTRTALAAPPGSVTTARIVRAGGLIGGALLLGGCSLLVMLKRRGER